MSDDSEMVHESQLYDLLNEWRALADDLYSVLDLLPSAVHELLKEFHHFDEVERAKARYREAREQ